MFQPHILHLPPTASQVNGWELSSSYIIGQSKGTEYNTLNCCCSSMGNWKINVLRRIFLDSIFTAICSHSPHACSLVHYKEVCWSHPVFKWCTNYKGKAASFQQWGKWAGRQRLCFNIRPTRYLFLPTDTRYYTFKRYSGSLLHLNHLGHHCLSPQCLQWDSPFFQLNDTAHQCMQTTASS